MATQNPAATDPIPIFISAPGGSDVLMIGVAIFLVGAVLGVGVLYWRLHALPEHLAHKSKKIQLDVVAVLTLLSLFTHEHIYWIAGLLLAFVELPDFARPLVRMAISLEKIAGLEPPVEPPAEAAHEPAVEAKAPDLAKGA